MTVSFHVEGDFHPEMPMRVLNLFAQRSLACVTAEIVNVATDTGSASPSPA